MSQKIDFDAQMLEQPYALRPMRRWQIRALAIVAIVAAIAGILYV